jgi:hypothetical protein
VTHWSSRLLAAALAAEGTPISHVTIARIWHRFGVQPWRAQTFKFSTDPELEGKICDVVGLYLHPPDKAVALCVDENPQIQVLQRTAPTLPVRPGQPEQQTFDYVQHGTTTLFAALGWPPARSLMPDRPAVSLSTPSAPPSAHHSAATSTRTGSRERRERHLRVPPDRVARARLNGQTASPPGGRETSNSKEKQT